METGAGVRIALFWDRLRETMRVERRELNEPLGSCRPNSSTLSRLTAAESTAC